MPVRIRLNTGPLKRFVEAEKRRWERVRREGLKKLRNKGVEILKKHVPKDTHEMERSCKGVIEGNKITIWPDVPYAHIIDGEGRTRASPGRYVPAIRRRLVRPSKRNPSIGMHPGAKKTPYSKKTIEEWRAEAEELIRTAVREAGR